MPTRFENGELTFHSRSPRPALGTGGAGKKGGGRGGEVALAEHPDPSKKSSSPGKGNMDSSGHAMPPQSIIDSWGFSGF